MVKSAARLIPTEIIHHIKDFSPDHRDVFADTIIQLASVYFKKDIGFPSIRVHV